jgi:N-acetylneuraminate lyase
MTTPLPGFTGLIVAPHTPLRADYGLDLDTIERQAAHFLASGLIGVFIGGSTGEGLSLTLAERVAVAQRWAEVARGTALKVIVHVGANCLAEAKSLAAHAQSVGAQGISAMAPCYYRPRDLEEFLPFAAAIASEAPKLPFYYYDIPSATGVRLPIPELLERGPTRIPNLAGVKYSNPDLVQLQQSLRVGGGAYQIYFGCDELLLAALALGIHGAVGGTYNFAASLYHQVVAAVRDGDLVLARARQQLAVRLFEVLLRFGLVPTGKAIMKLIGLDCGPVRPPLANLTSIQMTELEQALAPLHLLETKGAHHEQAP